MATRFLLPCPHCDHPIEVVPVQAGQEIICDKCQQRLTTPKLGALKQLPILSESPVSTLRPNTAVKRGLFAIGLTLAIVLGLAGTALYFYASSLIVDLKLQQQSQLWSVQVDEFSPSRLLAEWEKLPIEEGLPEWVEHPYARYRTQGSILQKIAYGLWSAAAIGGLMMLTSFWLPSK